LSFRHGICVLGASGYAGKAIFEALERRGFDVCGTYFRHPVPGKGLHRLDIGEGRDVTSLFRSLHPSVIVNAAADWSTKETMERTIVRGAAILAEACRKADCELVHISTDVVFDGVKGCYTESDPPNPVHDYGEAKALAESEISRAPDYLIIRTSLIIGHDGLDAQSRWIRDSLSEGKKIVLFTDEYRSPIWVEDLAESVAKLVELRETGIVHIAGTQGLSRYQLGTFLAKKMQLDPSGITPGLQSESGLVRPRDCTLNVNKALGLGIMLKPLAPEMEGKHCG